mgnify:CR=1 FL=1
MKVQNPIMMQVFTPNGRTRSQEPFENALQKAREQAGRLGALAPAVLAGGGGTVAAAVQTAARTSQFAGTEFGELQASQMDANMQYLKLQMEVQAENRWFSTLSNVIKSRHDTARAAISNLRA